MPKRATLQSCIGIAAILIACVGVGCGDDDDVAPTKGTIDIEWRINGNPGQNGGCEQIGATTVEVTENNGAQDGVATADCDDGKASRSYLPGSYSLRAHLIHSSGQSLDSDTAAVDVSVGMRSDVSFSFNSLGIPDPPDAGPDASAPAVPDADVPDGASAAASSL